MNTLKAVLFMLKCWLADSKNSGSNIYSYVHVDLYQKPFFEKKANFEFNHWAWFKWNIKEILSLLRTTKKQEFYKNWIISSNHKTLNTEKEYLSSISKIKDFKLILLNKSCGRASISDLFFLGVVLIFQLIVISPLHFIFPRNRMLFYFCIGICRITKFYNLISIQKPENVWIPNVSDTMQSMLVVLCKNENIKTITIANDLPFTFHKKHLIADDLVLNNPHQIDELKTFSSNVFGEVSNAISQDVFEYQQLTQNFTRTPQVVNSQTIGVCVSGYWLRKTKGRFYDKLKEFETAEEALIKKMIILKSENPNIELIWLFHPVELLQIDDAINYYVNNFPETALWNSTFKRKSWNYFNQVNLVVSVISTLTYTRLFMGYKAIFVTNNSIHSANTGIFKGISTEINSLNNTDLVNYLNQNATKFFEKNKITAFLDFPENIEKPYK